MAAGNVQFLYMLIHDEENDSVGLQCSRGCSASETWRPKEAHHGGEDGTVASSAASWSGGDERPDTCSATAASGVDAPLNSAAHKFKGDFRVVRTAEGKK